MKSLTTLLLAFAAPVGMVPAQHSTTDHGTAALDGTVLQQSGGCQPDWLPTFGGQAGTDSKVYAFTVFDDGSGSGPALFVGGEFEAAGGVVASRIAKWDGANWSRLGSGISGPSFSQVSALVVFDDGSGGGPALYAGGRFTGAGGIVANHIAKWDGTNWFSLGRGISSAGPSDQVQALTVFDDGSGGGRALYVGGLFTAAGDVALRHMAKWDGSNWSAVGSGITGAGSSDQVNSLAVFDDGSGGGPALYAGGLFASAGGVAANRIAKWDGASWSALGGGLGGAINLVLALAVFDDGSGGGPALFAGGNFMSAGGGAVGSTAKWDGATWSPVGSGAGGVNGTVWALTVFDDGSGGGPGLYAGGIFSSAGGSPASRLAKWDGANWSALGGGTNLTVFGLGAFDDASGGGPTLFAGGAFTTAGPVEASRIAQWDGAGWSPVVGSGGSGVNDGVLALTVFDDGGGGVPALYAGGRFTSAGGASANRIAKWDGASWSPVAGTGGSGFNGPVHALSIFDDGSGTALYAGGNFSIAGGAIVNRIAKWDGSVWSALGVGGPLSIVDALSVFDDGSGAGLALYAGRGLSVEKWDGNSWSVLTGSGGGMNGNVGTLAVFDDRTGGGPALFAGGSFTIVDGVAARRIAKWDGASWLPIGSGTGGIANATVSALAVFDDGSGAGPELFVGGNFQEAGDVSASHIAKWDGSNWSRLGSGMNNSVLSLIVFDDGGGPALYAGGRFTSAGGVPAKRLARWDGVRWAPVIGSSGSGMNDEVLAFTVFDDGQGGGPALVAGGDFTTSAAGDRHLARWGCPAQPPLSFFCSGKTTLVCGAASIRVVGSASATASSGFVVEAGPVRGCRAGLLLYSNQPDVPGVSFGGPGDGLLCMSGMGLRRAGPIDSGGTSAQHCDGILSIDVNQLNTFNWTAPGCDPAPGQMRPAGFLGSMGTRVYAQMWGRDSSATGQVLTGGLAWVVGS